MKVFLDTNIFYNDWFVKNANFKYLFHFLNNEENTLILSSLVVQEVENIRRRDSELYLSEIKKQVSRLQKLNSKQIKFDKNELGLEDYELLPLLESRVDNIEVFDYNSIPHSEVVHRALMNRKPFSDGEKGYRDTLIWLSFLNYIAKFNAEDEDIVFITNNKSDFFKTKDKEIKFHNDLKEDLREKKVKLKIKIFTSLFDFVNSVIDKNDHAIDRVNSEDIFEDFITESSADFIENMSNLDLSQYYENSIFDTKVRDILDIRVDVFEGLEDIEFINTTKLTDNDIYVSYRYNLRRVFVEIDIPKSDYSENKNELDNLFFDTKLSSEIATLAGCVRPYFQVSFIYNDIDGALKNFEVADLWLRH